MGKGDKKSKKGKRFKHSFGKTRPHKKRKQVFVKKKVEEKPKPEEQKKPARQEVEQEKPAVVTPVVEEVKISAPIVTEIKEEIKIPEVKQEPVPEIPEKKQEVSVPESKPVAEVSSQVVKDEEPKEAPKKRGRPKKKKED